MAYCWLQKKIKLDLKRTAKPELTFARSVDLSPDTDWALGTEAATNTGMDLGTTAWGNSGFFCNGGHSIAVDEEELARKRENDERS